MISKKLIKQIYERIKKENPELDILEVLSEKEFYKLLQLIYAEGYKNAIVERGYKI